MKTLAALTLLLLSSATLAQTSAPAPAPAASTSTPAASDAKPAPAAGKSITAVIRVTGYLVPPTTSENTSGTTVTVTQQDGSVQQVTSY